MIVQSDRAIALTCPACQIVQEHSFSLFTISHQPLQLLCHCGFSQGHFRQLKGNYELDVLGADGERVRLVLSKSDLLHTPLLNIAHKEGYELGFVGNPQAVEKAVLTSSRSIIADLDKVVNPQIMLNILETLQDLAKQHKIKCACEHPSVGIDIYVDKAELVCAFCGSTVIIGASTHNDQERLSRIQEIVMEPSIAQHLEKWLKPLN